MTRERSPGDGRDYSAAAKSLIIRCATQTSPAVRQAAYSAIVWGPALCRRWPLFENGLYRCPTFHGFWAGPLGPANRVKGTWGEVLLQKDTCSCTTMDHNVRVPRVWTPAHVQQWTTRGYLRWLRHIQKISRSLTMRHIQGQRQGHHAPVRHASPMDMPPSLAMESRRGFDQDRRPYEDQRKTSRVGQVCLQHATHLHLDHHTFA